MFSFTKFYVLGCLGYFNIANGQKYLLDLFPDVGTTVVSEIFEATISTTQIKKPGHTIRK